MVNVSQGDYRELTAGQWAFPGMITSCTMVYVRSESGRVVVYHWPFTAVTEAYKQKMTQAVNSINASGSVSYIKLFTKSNVGLQELINHLNTYTTNIETDLVGQRIEPFIKFDGSRMV